MDEGKLANLKELAQKAAPGEWRDGFNTKIYGEYRGLLIPIAKVFSEKDAKYIATANPATILELIADYERLEKEADWMARQLLAKDNAWRHEGFLVDMIYSVEEWHQAAREAVELALGSAK